MRRGIMAVECVGGGVGGVCVSAGDGMWTGVPPADGLLVANVPCPTIFRSSFSFRTTVSLYVGETDNTYLTTTNKLFIISYNPLSPHQTCAVMFILPYLYYI